MVEGQRVEYQLLYEVGRVVGCRLVHLAAVSRCLVKPQRAVIFSTGQRLSVWLCNY